MRAKAGSTKQASTALDVGRDLSEVRRARAWAREQLADTSISPDDLMKVEVMVSELVTNVVRHTPEGCTIDLRHDEHQVTVELLDHSGRSPVVQPADPTRPSGNGLRLVDAYASSWGSWPETETSKVVWFELRF